MNSQAKSRSANRFTDRWLPMIAWGVALLLVVVMVFLIVRRAKAVFYTPVEPTAVVESTQPEAVKEQTSQLTELPGFEPSGSVYSINRHSVPHTVIPTKARSGIEEYIVGPGDSVFSIAVKYNLQPETILWANSDQLQDNPNMLSVDMKLRIPPVDGVLYQWKPNDYVEKISGDFSVTPEDILTFPGNKLDLTNPVIEAGQYVMIPGGEREFQQWIIPTVWRANAGATQSIAGPGSCSLDAGGAYGSGSFIWPTANTYLSGNDYWSGHLGVDIATPTGMPVWAADSGLVVYSGSIGGGYGLMVMIDHGNGYHTLYAHNSDLVARCGQSVSQGQVIAYSGSTGNSTGPHLHFEVRYNGGFINPWYVLP